jgi:hypothetical protein
MKKGKKMKVLNRSTAKRRTTSKKRSKKTAFLSRFQGLSLRSQLLVFGIVFAAIGGGYYLYQSFASDGLPDKANEIIVSYEIGMNHVLPDDSFPTGPNGTGLLLYGNGLLLCSPGTLSMANMPPEQMAQMPDSGLMQRQLNRDEVHAFVDNLKKAGFDTAFASKSKVVPLAGKAHSILLNSAEGATSIYSMGSSADPAGVAQAESFLKAECTKATTAYDPDDVYAETITLPNDNPAAKTAAGQLPAGFDVDPTPKESKSKNVTGKDAKALKSSVANGQKVYTTADGKVVRARVISKIPDYKDPKPKQQSTKGKVSAASTYKVRFIAVIPQGVTTPGWATSASVQDSANSIRSWYYSKTGKYFDFDTSDPLNFKVVRGSKTTAQYMTCPSATFPSIAAGGVQYNFPCGGGSSPASNNLLAEYRKPGVSTIIISAIDTRSDALGWGWQGSYDDSDGYISNVGLVGVAFAGNSDADYGVKRVRRTAAHELGHNMGPQHVCSATLMWKGGSCPLYASWPDTALDGGQAANLKTYSKFFNAPTAPPPILNVGPFGDSTLDSSGRINIFVRSSDQQLYGRTQTAANASGWNGGYYPLGGLLNSNVAAVNNQNGSMQLFVRGLDNKLYTQGQPCPTCSFSGWMQIGGAATVSSDPKAVLGNDGRIRVFINSNTIGAVLTQNTSNNISSWPTSYTFLPGASLSSNITVAKNKDGTIQAFARTGAADVVTYLGNSDNTFTRGWVSLGGGITSDVSVTAAGDGRLYIFVRGLDKRQVFVNNQNNTTDPLSWSGYTSLSGGITSNIAAASNADGRVQIFARGLGGDLWTNYQTCPTCGFSGWVGLGGTTTSDPSVVKMPDGRLEVFVRGNPDGAFSITQSAANGSFTSGAYVSLGGGIAPLSALNMINQ